MLKSSPLAPVEAAAGKHHRLDRKLGLGRSGVDAVHGGLAAVDSS